MKRCIFCRKLETEFDNKNCWTEEHIIPQSLGNETLKIYNVCKKCNSGLGTHIDNYFVNNRIVKIIRQQLGLKGQSGKIPNAFEVGKDKDGHQIRVDENLTPKIVPYTERNGDNLRIVAPSKDEAKKMIEKILTRMHIDNDYIQKVLSDVDQPESHYFKPEIEYDVEIDFNRFFAEALKIAYEYAIYKLGDAFLIDQRAQEIQRYLKSAIDGNMKLECTQPTGVCILPPNLAETITDKSSIHCHILIIHSNIENKLICEVILFMEPMLSFSVLLSDDASKYNVSFNLDIVDIKAKPFKPVTD